MSKLKWTTRVIIPVALGIAIVGVGISILLYVESPTQVAAWEESFQAERADGIRHIDETGEWPLDGPRNMLVDGADPLLMKILLNIELHDRHGDGPGIASIPKTGQVAIWGAVGMGLALIFTAFILAYRARRSTKPPKWSPPAR